MKRLGALLLLAAGAATAHATVPGNWVRGPSAPAAVTASGGGLHPNMPVCRGRLDNGMHPGKLWAGSCNIGWGGVTKYVKDYELLVGRYTWVTATVDGKPANAVDGGSAGDAAGHVRLGVCEVFNGGDASWHPGKFYAGKCNYAWGGSDGDHLGKEIAVVPNGNVRILVAM